MKKFTDYLKEEGEAFSYASYHNDMMARHEKVRADLDRTGTHLSYLQGGLEYVGKTLEGIISNMRVGSDMDLLKKDLSDLSKIVKNLDKRAEEYAAGLKRT